MPIVFLKQLSPEVLRDPGLSALPVARYCRANGGTPGKFFKKLRKDIQIDCIAAKISSAKQNICFECRDQRTECVCKRGFFLGVMKI
jgi:hypothetical protein